MFYQDRAFCGYRDLSWIGRHLFNDYAGCTNEIWEFIENYNDLDSGQMSIIHRFIGLTGQAGWVGAYWTA